MASSVQKPTTPLELSLALNQVTRRAINGISETMRHNRARLAATWRMLAQVNADRSISQATKDAIIEDAAEMMAELGTQFAPLEGGLLYASQTNYMTAGGITDERSGIGGGGMGLKGANPLRLMRGLNAQEKVMTTAHVVDGWANQSFVRMTAKILTKLEGKKQQGISDAVTVSARTPIARYLASVGKKLDRADYVSDLNTALTGNSSSLVMIHGGDAKALMRDASAARFIA